MPEVLAAALTLLSSVGLIACVMRWLVASFEPDNPGNTVARDVLGALAVVASAYVATRLQDVAPLAAPLASFAVAVCVFRLAFGFALGLALLSSFLLSLIVMLLGFAIVVSLALLAGAHLALAVAAAVVLAGVPAAILARQARADAGRARRGGAYPPALRP